MSDGVFAGRCVVVTGGGSGIGRATALAFARQGAAKVVVTGRRLEPLQETAQVYEAIVPVVADVRTEEGAEMVAEAINDSAALDVLVHNAGVVRGSPLESFELADVTAVWETNVVGPMVLTRRLLPQMKSPGANIVLVSSVVGQRYAVPGTSIYGASKSAVDNLTRSWAVELAGRGIRVNAVAPGGIKSAAMKMQPSAEQLRQMFLVGRRGEPEEVAGWIIHLAQPDSGFVTGQIIAVDGGMGLAQL
ncbi:SDR family oxidoreductase [Nocardia sp. NPDC046473]|uniref:SDR family NAD(P)-dependent oxidoreductase n=1 Tax=Nocardia sp. NPDC046473 TaxID=3155733 RepID=UPI0033C718A5